MTCEHKRLKHGYEKTYDVQWCLNCGVITHSSDGLIGPGLHKRADWSDWINVNLEAWSCRNEAHDGKRCSHWCGGATCPASIRMRKMLDVKKLAGVDVAEQLIERIEAALNASQTKRK